MGSCPGSSDDSDHRGGLPTVRIDESNLGGLPIVHVDESNLGDFESLLAEAGLTTEIDAEAACTDFRVLGVDFASRYADVLQGYFVPGARP